MERVQDDRKYRPFYRHYAHFESSCVATPNANWDVCTLWQHSTTAILYWLLSTATPYDQPIFLTLQWKVHSVYKPVVAESPPKYFHQSLLMQKSILWDTGRNARVGFGKMIRNWIQHLLQDLQQPYYRDILPQDGLVANSPDVRRQRTWHSEIKIYLDADYCW